MLYECVRCKTTKFFAHPAATETAYCITCQCSRRFVPGTLPERKSMSLVHKTMDRSSDEEHRNTNEIVARPPAHLARSSTMTIKRPCNYFKLCLEFLLTLDCSKRLFNRQHNRCYCEDCYPSHYNDFYIRGGVTYVIPRGWVRFGLYIDDVKAKVEDIWNKWIVSYHGTSPEAAKSIIEHRQFLLPGDKLIDGHVIKIHEGHIPGKFQVYTSPTIAYSSLDVYSPLTKFPSNTGKVYKAKTVLQCRQQPGTFKTQAETVAARNQRICPFIPNSEIELLTEIRSSIVPNGLLIRVFE